MDVKGNKNYASGAGVGAGGLYPEVNQGTIERQFYGIESGPRMLPRQQRLKVWLALTAIGLWFTGCFSLVAYRLKSDDLELMEREVYEELKVKKEVQRFQERQRNIDKLAGKSGSSGDSALSDQGGKMVGEFVIPKSQ